jgi:hypothetical protein
MGNDQWIASRANTDLGDNLGSGGDSPWVVVAMLSPAELDFHKSNGGLWIKMLFEERDPFADELFFQDFTYDFGTVTGAQIISATSANPQGQLIDEQLGLTANPVSMRLSIRVRAVLR